MLQAIIIDDEPDAIKTLEWELRKYAEKVRVVATFTNPVEGLGALLHQPPDILFLDIEMPRLNGFDLLDKLQKIDFEVIFVTAYDEYAVKAFRVNAIDYLLKPIIGTDLDDAIIRVCQKQTDKDAKGFSRKLEQLRATFSKIPLVDGDGIEFVDEHQVLYLQSEGSYTHVILQKKKVLITRSLGEMQTLLPENNFMRVHRSFIVNLNHIQKYIRHDGGYLVMANGDKVAVSRRKKDALLSLFE